MSAAAITIYSTPTCAFCHAAKEYMTGKSVAFIDKDITTDTDAQQWVLSHTGQLAVPVIDINGTIIIGFDRNQVDLALRTHKLI